MAGGGSVLPVPVELIVAVLGIVVTVLTVYGAILKYLYDGHTTLDQRLTGSNGDDGFIQEAQDSHQELSQSQREIERTLQAHGALLQELVYTLRRVEESLEDDESLEDIDTRRLEHLEERLRDSDAIQAESPDYISGSSDEDD